jgi:plastocyanin
MARRLTSLLLCLCLAASGGLAVAGCGSDSNRSSSKAKKKSKKKKKKAAAGGGAAVSMQNIAFNPQTITVKQGGTVTWTNDEAVGHDVTADDGSFQSGESGGMMQGDTFEHTFDQAGSFTYKCTVHPNMTGTVEVTR